MRRCLNTRMTASIVDKFWAPFTQNITGPDLRTYNFSDVVRKIARPGVFTCQVNGVVGGVPLVEDLFWTILSGFDIENVQVKEVCHEQTSASGTVRLVHRRPFMGWTPSADGMTGELTLDLPFYMRGEGNFHSGELSHLTIRTPLADTLRGAREVPPCAIELVENMEAVRMLVALRRANVKPALITDRMLRSASKKQDTWCNALGLM